MTDNTISHFIVLFTAQKQKKAKTWQDGTMKYYSFNRKLVLTDEKGYNIDRKFHKGGIPIAGDELEFDGHIVTIESFESTEVVNNQPPVAAVASEAPTQPVQSYVLPPPPLVVSSPALQRKFKSPAMTIPKKRIVQMNDEEEEEEEGDTMKMYNEPSASHFAPQPPQHALPSPTLSNDFTLQEQLAPSSSAIETHVTQKKQLSTVSNVSTTFSATPQKRVRVGLSKRTASTLHQSTHSNISNTTITTTRMNATGSIPMSNPSRNISAAAIPSNSAAESSFTPASRITTITNPDPTSSKPSTASSSAEDPTVKPFQSPFAEGNYALLVFQFPNQKKAFTVLKTKKYPKRSKVVPTKFANPNLYRETFKKIIHEHLEIILLNFAIYFYGVYEKFAKGKQGSDLERIFRSKGVGMYVQCELKGDLRFQSSQRIRLMVKHNREHYSKYNKDDIWVISKVFSFESSQTFLARSTYFGPFSDGSLEIDCISPRDIRIATKILTENRPTYAIRTIGASTEFMMLDTLNEKLDQLPLLPYILQNPSSHLKKKKNQIVSPQPLPIMDHIQIKREDHIDVESKIKEVVIIYRLNGDQASVLRRVARSVITCPSWNNEPEHPIVLVHGVYGSGKSFLAAVIIIFIHDIIEAVNEKREPGDYISFKILVSSMTNVAVDRILQTLLKLGYDHFIRIGSIKKIAKNLLPYTSKARLTSNEELKELEQMLEDPQNSEEDVENISTAIQKFRKTEGNAQIQNTDVVGTTFMSSTFEVFNNIKFPFVLVDESSQLMEPLTMVPLARFSCHRLVMIGDPLQLPPTISSHAEEGKIGKGLDKTLFDRMIEMGHESVMLRTQYRCHPRISNISNKLFYDGRLLNGVTNEERKPLIDGLPTLLFVDVGGTEQKSMRTNSFWNDTEIAISAHIIQTMISFDISPSELGVISLYKEQADKISEFLSSGSTDSTTSKNVQISTVDAFQGGEKEVVILSTVRTTESQFMDNQPRINVALTRAKRHLIILGNKSLFAMNELWSKVLWECQENCMNRNHLAKLLSDLEATKRNQI